MDLKDLILCIKGLKKVNKRKKYFCLTFDDCPHWDYHQYSDNIVGDVKSFHQIIKESGLFKAHKVSAMSFAIVSESVRTELDRTCIASRGDWSSNWWESAIDEGFIQIGNHSLDHLHPTLNTVYQSNNIKGDFHQIKTYDDANTQIRVSNEELLKLTNNKSSPYFAYPYGHVSDYLKSDYFPYYQHEHQLKAAFSTAGIPATKDSNIWDIPRMVCGEHWKSTDELIEKINNWSSSK